MISGYNNFPDEMFDDDGTLITAHVIPGLYDEITKRFNNNKPFFANFKLSTGVKMCGCPAIFYDPVFKRYVFFIATEALQLGKDNMIVPFDT